MVQGIMGCVVGRTSKCDVICSKKEGCINTPRRLLKLQEPLANRFHFLENPVKQKNPCNYFYSIFLHFSLIGNFYKHLDFFFF